jgi:hypothetical protein
MVGWPRLRVARTAIVGVALALLVGAPTAAQLPPAPARSAELGPAPPRDPLPRLEWQVDGAWQTGCVVTLVEGLGVLAARHCGVRRDGLRVRFGEERRTVVGAVLPPSPSHVEGRYVHPEHDWAILELDRPPPPMESFPFVGRAGLVGADRFHRLTKLGPGGGRAPERGTCWPLEIAPNGRVFTFRCTEGTGPGRSGSPLLVALADRWGLVGMHVAEFDGPEGRTGIDIVPPDPADIR